MDSQELSLIWDDHHSTLVREFEKLLESSTLVDCTIAAEGQYLKAHRVVLSACSPYFELLFKEENEKNPIIILQDVKFRELKAVIDFVYRGKVRISEECLGDFVTTAESLQIKGLGGSHKRDVSENKDVKSSRHMIDSDVSSVLRKRIRRRRLSNHVESLNSFHSVLDNASESPSCESFPQHEESPDVPVFLSSVLTTSLPTCSSSGMPRGLRVQEEFNSDSVRPFPSCVEPTPSFIPLSETHLAQFCTETMIKSEPEPVYLQPTHSSLPLTETHSSLPSAQTVLKSEPEPIEEIYLSDTEVYNESKQVLCAEKSSLLESEDGMNIAAVDNQCEENSTQFSSAASPETTTADVDPLSTQPLLSATAHASLRRSRCAAAAEASPFEDSPPFLPATHACTLCGKDCGSTSHVTCNARAPTGERPFARAECAKAFSQMINLQNHLRVHTGKRPYVCATCGKACKEKVSFQNHLRLHTGERPFACEVCGSRFGRKDVLRKHMCKHTGERPFVCEVCGRDFGRKDALQIHKVVHTRERAFTCELCNKTFGLKKNLQVHKRAHTGVLPFACGLCGKAFFRRQELARHLRRHTNEVEHQ